MNDREKERANSYRDMMKLWAWKDFELFLDSEKQIALERAIISDEIKDVQLNRGKVKMIDSIKANLDGIIEGR